MLLSYSVMMLVRSYIQVTSLKAIASGLGKYKQADSVLRKGSTEYLKQLQCMMQ